MSALAERVVHIPVVCGLLLKHFEPDNRLLAKALYRGLQAVVFRAQAFVV